MSTKKLAFLTSGGDSPGMNAAIRAVVRTGLAKNADVYAIWEGYQGLVDGGDRLKKVGWSFVAGILNKGGTVIGSARCKEFRTRDGRKQAALNLVTNGINYLVVIGGDGSLTGANLMRTEWVSLLSELVDEKKISEDSLRTYEHLAIVGLVGSIDNDMCGTDITIGADTALHRILEAIDSILSTAVSHQRSFVVEVMGRNCGWLAMMAGLATGADYVLIPESPPDEGWEEKMATILEKGRLGGRRCSLVLVAEGAIDQKGNPISSNYVKKVLERTGHDTRITILGHVQRGGTPSALDRITSTLMGVAAVESVLQMGPSDEPLMIGMIGNNVVRSPLMQCVENTRAVGKAIEAREFHTALNLRGPSFNTAWQIYCTLSKPPDSLITAKHGLRIGIIHSGAPSPGMNPAVRALVRLGIDGGHTMLGIHDGFAGLAKGEIQEMSWMSVNGWAVMGGAELGTNRSVPTETNIEAIASYISKFNIQVLVMFGGFTGYQGVATLQQFKDRYPVLDIPLICIPGTIANNVPATETSIGADTALNNIMDALDKIKQSAVASRRVFVVCSKQERHVRLIAHKVEVMGADCGYLAVMSALASGAERAYINEEGVTLKDLQDDLQTLIQRFHMDHKLGLIVTSEKASETYSTNFIASLLKEEGKKLFDVRESILGHLQQGGSPSAYDRTNAALLMGHCMDLINTAFKKMEASSSQKLDLPSGVVGFQEGKIIFIPMEKLSSLMHPSFRRPQQQWWMSLIPIGKMLATMKLQTPE